MHRAFEELGTAPYGEIVVVGRDRCMRRQRNTAQTFTPCRSGAASIERQAQVGGKQANKANKPTESSRAARNAQQPRAAPFPWRAAMAHNGTARAGSGTSDHYMVDASRAETQSRARVARFKPPSQLCFVSPAQSCVLETRRRADERVCGIERVRRDSAAYRAADCCAILPADLIGAAHMPCSSGSREGREAGGGWNDGRRFDG